MSLWGKLFGGSKPTEVTTHEYNGYAITPMPIKEGSEFRVSAKITKDINGKPHEHVLIRADTAGSIEAAEEISVAKSKQVIDQIGDGVFR